MYDIEQIKRDEGFRATPYKCTADKLTIGFGTNLEAGITKEQGEALLIAQLKQNELALQRNLEWYSRAPEELQNVLHNMTYQLGISGVIKFRKTLAFMANGEYKEASKEMLDSKWARQTPLRAQRLSDRVRDL